MKRELFSKEGTFVGNAFKSIFKFITSFFFPKTNSRKFLKGYLSAILIGSLLLISPLSLKTNVKTNGGTFSWIDSLFTATSAFSDTGLVVTTTATQFTGFGHFIILVLILLGGIGIMSFKIFALTLLGKKIGLKDRILLQDERGSGRISETISLFRTSMKTILGGTLFGILALTPYFYFVNQEQPYLQTAGKLGSSLWQSLFHSVSAINNAGFDITGTSSLLPYANDIWVQLVFIILIIIGGIGFPVIHDLSRFRKHKKNKITTPFKWSLFTKITVLTYFIIFVIGLIMTVTIEIGSANANSLWNLASNGGVTSIGRTFSKSEVINGMIFSVFSTRSAGFSTIPVHLFQEPTRMLWSSLMWIGSSPASTAGGIRTTTIAVAFLALISSWYGTDRVFAFKHKIPQKTVRRALSVIFTSLLLTGIAILIILLDVSFTSTGLVSSSNYVGQIIFEVYSAFGTTGLSSGITPMLGWVSLTTLIVLMIVGQLGITTALLLLSSGESKNSSKDRIYGEEDVRVS